MALSQFLRCLSDITDIARFTPDVIHHPTILTSVMSLDGVLSARFVTRELCLSVVYLVTGDTVATVKKVVPRWSRIPATARSSSTATVSTPSPTTTSVISSRPAPVSCFDDCLGDVFALSGRDADVGDQPLHFVRLVQDTQGSLDPLSKWRGGGVMSNYQRTDNLPLLVSVSVYQQ